MRSTPATRAASASDIPAATADRIAAYNSAAKARSLVLAACHLAPTRAKFSRDIPQ